MPALLASFLSFPLVSFADEAQELRAAIVMRCYYAVGEFGAELVDRCVKEDTAAYEAMQSYPSEAKAAIQSCTNRLQGDGFGRIKACADEALKSGSKN